LRNVPLLFIIVQMLALTRSIRLNSGRSALFGGRDFARLMTISTAENGNNGDVLITGLNGPQDISVKVISCRELVQETIIRNDLSSQSAK
jgi:hypothetical protein